MNAGAGAAGRRHAAHRPIPGRIRRLPMGRDGFADTGLVGCCMCPGRITPGTGPGAPEGWDSLRVRHCRRRIDWPVRIPLCHRKWEEHCFRGTSSHDTGWQGTDDGYSSARFDQLESLRSLNAHQEPVWKFLYGNREENISTPYRNSPLSHRERKYATSTMTALQRAIIQPEPCSAHRVGLPLATGLVTGTMGTCT